jgi:hypothetical protein
VSANKSFLSQIEWREPLLLLFVTVMAYGLLIPWLGFYWDDWWDVVLYDLGGVSGQVAGYLVDRPIEGLQRSLWSSVLGQTPLHWHVFALVGRFIWTLAFWWLLRLIWPERHFETFLMSLLFAVFPGFTQQAIARTYVSGNLISVLAMVSYCTMVMAVSNRKRRWIYVATSMALIILALSSNEYFFGLELWRPILLLVLFRRQSTEWTLTIRRSLKLWTPYAAFIAFYFVFRTFFFESARGNADAILYSHLYALRYDTIGTLITHAMRLYAYIAGTAVLPLFMPINVPRLANWSLSVFGFWVVSIIVTSVIYRIYVRYTRFDHVSVEDVAIRSKVWTREAILLGSTALVLSVSHIFAAGYNVVPETVHDRPTRVAMFGFVILFISALSVLISNKKRILVVISVLVGLSSGYHLMIGDQFRQHWFHQQAFMRQFVWRVPDLTPHTTTRLYASSFNSFPRIVWNIRLYQYLAYDKHTYDISNIPYWIHNNIQPDYNTDIVFKSRTLTYRTHSNKILTLAFYPPYCLRVVDPDRLDEYPYLSNTARLAGEKSRIELINPVETPMRPLAQKLFFDEADSTCWCFYIEKAELARQFGEWDRVVALGDEMRAREVTQPAKENALELTVFMEAYARMGRYSDAEATAERIAEQPWGRFSVRSICQRLERELSANDDVMAFVQRVRAAHNIDGI